MVARALLWFVFGLSAASCLAWLVLPPELRPHLLRFVRPHAAAGALACSVALGTRLYPSRGPMAAPWIGSAAAALAIGVGLVASWWQVTSGTFFGLHGAGDAQDLSPLSAVMLTVLGSVSLAYGLVGGAQPLVLLADGVCVGIGCCATGFLLTAAPAIGAADVPVRPGTALLYAALSLSLRLSSPRAGSPSQREAALGLLLRALWPGLLRGSVGAMAVHLAFASDFTGPTVVGRSALQAAVWVALLLWWLQGATKVVAAHLHTERLRRRRLLARLRAVRTRQRRLDGIWRAVTPHAVVATDETGRITHFNAGAERLLGLRTDEVVGQRNVTDLYAPRELTYRAAAMGLSPGFDVIRAVPKLGRWDERGCVWQNHVGIEVPVHVTACAYASPDGRLTGYAFWARPPGGADHAQRDRDGYLHVSQELLVKTDADNRIFEASPSFESVLGWSPQALVGREVTEFLHPDDVAAANAAVAKIHSGKQVRHFESRWRAKTGAWRTIRWNAATPLGDRMSYGGGLDVTDAKRQAREREEHLAFERKIVGIVSHDLRNPITAISMAEQLMRREPTCPATVLCNLERIGQSVAHAERLLHDLLDFSRARIGGGLPIRVRNGCVVAHVRRTVQAAQLMRPEQRFICEAPPVLVAAVDPERLSQCVANLLRNAVVHGDGLRPITLTLWAPAEGGLALRVHNFGPAIAPSNFARLCEPFWQGQARKRSNGEQNSVGLGLYIVQQVVQAHAGQLQVESDEDTGTSFTVRLFDQDQHRELTQSLALSPPQLGQSN